VDWLLEYSDYSDCCEKYGAAFLRRPTVSGKEKPDYALPEGVYAGVARNGVTVELERDFYNRLREINAPRPGLKVFPIAALVHREAPEIPLDDVVVQAHLLLGIVPPAVFKKKSSRKNNEG